MNEKVRELAEQCYEKHELLGTYEFNKEKFAELIVRQCICLCDDENSQKYIAQKFGLAKELELE